LVELEANTLSKGEPVEEEKKGLKGFYYLLDRKYITRQIKVFQNFNFRYKIKKEGGVKCF